MNRTHEKILQTLEINEVQNKQNKYIFSSYFIHLFWIMNKKARNDKKKCSKIYKNEMPLYMNKT